MFQAIRKRMGTGESQSGSQASGKSGGHPPGPSMMGIAMKGLTENRAYPGFSPL
ncbi:MAG TPA: hypothetical protein VGO36_03925 [Solirubrobacterales bacterium]|jgi:hypothetical protein|nr:hypothetical protein [Solirubrobacterales bacterium]